MNTQMKATQELSDAQLEAISGGCCKRYEDDCYQKRHCDQDSEEKSYCDDSYNSSSDCNYDSSSCHERRHHRHHGCSY